MLMVIFKVIIPEQVYSAIDLSVPGLLFGIMVASIYKERADMFRCLGVLLSWNSWGAKGLLRWICIVSSILSVFFSNDILVSFSLSSY
jgi:Na+/H+ antiporter NhaD/arsenite permease-like protein